MLWLRANPEAGPAAASRQFPTVSINTIKSWQKRARDEGRVPRIEAPRGELTVLRPGAAAPVDPDLAALANLPLRELARVALVQRLVRLAAPVDPLTESVMDSAKIVQGLSDRVGVFEQLEPVREEDPTSEAGRKALIEALKGIPADVLTEAAARAS